MALAPKQRPAAYSSSPAQISEGHAPIQILNLRDFTEKYAERSDKLRKILSRRPLKRAFAPAVRAEETRYGTKEAQKGQHYRP